MPLEVHDISVPTHAGMLITGAQPEKTTKFSIAAGDEYNVSGWSLHVHTGTHLETQLHFVEGREPIDEVRAGRLVGPAQVLDLTGVASEEIGPDDLVAAGFDSAERVLLKTRNSEDIVRRVEKAESWTGLGVPAAEPLRKRGARLIGIDYLSVETPASEASGDWPVHNTLCGGGVLLLEMIDLRGIEPGEYLLASLPLRLQGSEAAPARTVLIGGVSV